MTTRAPVADQTAACNRCGRDSDMTCPVADSLDELIDSLSERGYEPYFNELDARFARSALSVCTNCGARGRFAYTGLKSEHDYRVFWSCGSCCHWVEV